ncbi:hypothetical protein HPP92_022444 [Vanilla planifolia]|uniref:Uncharacterized protein n=1 Tax=Vanilla planifolia TaxID=51239 RepID=A0A835PVP8_VANPL|nr:hypothetical protein HPP92_022444 [Vanilla planifolia]
MTGKAKPKKHTAKEIAAKVDAATTNRGGGKAGMADRTGQEKGGHAKLECPLCKVTAPDLKSMQIHHEARHPKIPFDESKLNDLHASHVAEPSKSRPGVRGKQVKVVHITFRGRWNCRGILLTRKQTLQAEEGCIRQPKPVQGSYWTMQLDRNS